MIEAINSLLRNYHKTEKRILSILTSVLKYIFKYLSIYIKCLTTNYRSGSGYHYIERLPRNWKPFSYCILLTFCSYLLPLLSADYAVILMRNSGIKATKRFNNIVFFVVTCSMNRHRLYPLNY